MPTIDVLEATTHLSRLLESVESGAETEIVIARKGKPVARLVPIPPTPSAGKRLGLLEGRYPDFSLDEFNATDSEVLELFIGEESAKRFLSRT